MKKSIFTVLFTFSLFILASCESTENIETPSDIDYDSDDFRNEFEGSLEFILRDIDQYEIVSYNGNNEFLFLPDTYQNTPITKIGDGVFMNQNINSIKLGKYIKEISQFAFANNSITDLIIPSSVIVIGDEAFSNNPFLSINILGDRKRFNDRWEYIGFPQELVPYNSNFKG